MSLATREGAVPVSETSRHYIAREMRAGRRVVIELPWPNGRLMVSGVEADSEDALLAMVSGQERYPWEQPEFTGWLYFETWDEAAEWVRA